MRAPDVAEPVAAFANGRFAQHVQPKRRLAAPAVRYEFDLVGAQDGRADVPRDALTGRERRSLPAFEVVGGERRVRLVVDCARDRLRQLDQ